MAGILTLVCASVYYFSYTNRIKDIPTRLANRAITTAQRKTSPPEELLFTAIRNIVSNACKYSGDHHAIVRLSIGSKEIAIAVKDKGRGIAAEDLYKIFQPFYRSDDGKAIPGFGLGLSLSRRIIQLHKGAITVDSIVGQGSVFTISLPIAAFAQPATVRT